MTGRLILAATAAVLLALPGRAETLADALVKAYQTNPTLQISREQLRQADERVAQAQSDFLPDVTATATGTLGQSRRLIGQGTANIATELTTDARITGTVTLESFGRTPAQVAAAVASVLAARARLVSVEQDVLLEAVTAYLDVRRDIDFVDLARNNIRVNTELLRAAQDRFEVGEVTRTDVSQAEAALAAARANLARNTGALAQSRADYRASVGEEPKDLSPPPPIPELPKSRDEAEAVAMREHPALTAARYNEEAAARDVDLARAGLNPLLTLSGSVFYQRQDEILRDGRGPDRGDTLGAEIELQLQVPLYRGGELSSLIRQALSVLEQRKAETQDTGRSIRRAVEVAWSGLMVARASIQASAEEIQAQQLAFEGVREEAKFGERTTLDVLDAEQNLLQARSNLVSAQRDQYVAAYNLLSAMGLLTVSHLGLGVTPYDPAANYEVVRRNPASPEGLRLERILDRWGQ